MSRNRKKKSIASLPSKLSVHAYTDAYYGMSFDRIGPGLVMSRDDSGYALCFFEDSAWPMSHLVHSSTDVPIISFPSTSPEHSDHEENMAFRKTVLIACLFAPGRKTGKPLRLTQVHTINNTLRNITEYCEQNNIESKALLMSSELLEKFLQAMPPSQIRSLLTIGRTIQNNDLSKHYISISPNALNLIVEANAAYRSASEPSQTPIIPSSILAKTYIQHITVIKDYNKNSQKIKRLLNKVASNPEYARAHPKTKHTKLAYLNHINFSHALKIHNLSTIADKYQWTEIPNITSFLSTVQYCAKNLIHLFTLMRDHEALNLKPDCIEPIVGWNQEALYVITTTTKLMASAQVLKWITIPAVLRPLEALRSIHETVAPYSSDEASKKWLFISPSHLPFSNGRPPSGRTRKIIREINLPPIKITDQDIRELESIDPHRNWRGDKNFQIGAPWKLNSHQFRRSIAVFAGQSGLITIQSLKRLLQHLTRTMSIYYQKGCSAENYNIGLGDPQLAKDLAKGKAEGDNALYLRNIILTNEKLGGFHGKRVMQQKASDVWILDSEGQFQQSVRMNIQACEPTCFGVCTNPDPCDKRAHSNILSCPGCEHCTVVESVIDESIQDLAWDLKHLKMGSVEYRAEEANLMDLKNMRDMLIAKG
ncbi:integrase [Pseudomonas sp. NPDC089547]|uniref:integrase n=1 Tax=Pseudomonas sp. NPDC089547 TaxID=3390652 RepID=UPI003CFDE9D5